MGEKTKAGKAPIFECGDNVTYTKQFAKNPLDGQWHYRLSEGSKRRFGRWIPTQQERPTYAFYTGQKADFSRVRQQ